MINNENSIRLIIKREFAEQIKSGEKKREYRCDSAFYQSKLYLKSATSKDGYTEQVENSGKKIFAKIKDIRYIVFQEGYTKNTFTCECTGWGYIKVKRLPEMNENDILYKEHQKEKPQPLIELVKNEFEIDKMNEDDLFFLFCLGKIVED